MNKLKKIFLLGGSISLLEAALILKNEKKKFFIFTSKRQLKDKILNSSLTLEDGFKKNKINYNISKDINKDKKFISNFDKESLCVGFGEPWKFDNRFIEKHKGRLLDFMCIPLPFYRGGAHYTWMSLMEEKNGAVCLQEITKNTLQGEYDDGLVILRINYKINSKFKPINYFSLEKINAKKIFNLFFKKIKNFNNFKKKPINEKDNLFFPRLNTKRNGWVNWNWTGNDILKFINSFDEPYAGASTRYILSSKNNKIVHLKNVIWENKKIRFHPYQSGLIINKKKDGIIAATVNGSIKIGNVFDDNNNEITKHIILGKRLYSTYRDIEKSYLFLPKYN